MPEVFHQHKGNPWTAFAINPADWKFETQEKGERIILLLRQHPVVNLGWLLLTLILALLPLAWEILPVRYLPERFALMTLVMWYLLILAFVLERFLDWYFNVYIVTDERVVDIDFYGLLYRDMSVTQLNKIQDIRLIQGGGAATVFDFGNIQIQTAGEEREFEFSRVPHPARVVEILYQLLQEEEQEALEGRVK